MVPVTEKLALEANPMPPVIDCVAITLPVAEKADAILIPFPLDVFPKQFEKVTVPPAEKGPVVMLTPFPEEELTAEQVAKMTGP